MRGIRLGRHSSTATSLRLVESMSFDCLRGTSACFLMAIKTDSGLSGIERVQIHPRGAGSSSPDSPAKATRRFQL